MLRHPERRGAARLLRPRGSSARAALVSSDAADRGYAAAADARETRKARARAAASASASAGQVEQQPPAAKQRDEKEVTPIVIASVTVATGRGATFVTDDGAVWRQGDSHMYTLPAAPFKATIEPGAGGSFFLRPGQLASRDSRAPRSLSVDNTPLSFAACRELRVPQRRVAPIELVVDVHGVFRSEVAAPAQRLVMSNEAQEIADLAGQLVEIGLLELRRIEQAVHGLEVHVDRVPDEVIRARRGPHDRAVYTPAGLARRRRDEDFDGALRGEGVQAIEARKEVEVGAQLVADETRVPVHADVADGSRGRRDRGARHVGRHGARDGRLRTRGGNRSAGAVST